LSLNAPAGGIAMAFLSVVAGAATLAF
jgi:hypothetical protein